MERLNEKLVLLRSIYTHCADAFWDFKFEVMIEPDMVVGICIERDGVLNKYDLGEKVFALKTFEVYESAWNFGSGAVGRVNRHEQLYVTGICYLNTKGGIENSTYVPFPELNNLVTKDYIDTSAPHYMVHLSRTDGSDAGWAFPTSVVPILEPTL